MDLLGVEEVVFFLPLILRQESSGCLLPHKPLVSLLEIISLIRLIISYNYFSEHILEALMQLLHVREVDAGQAFLLLLLLSRPLDPMFLLYQVELEHLVLEALVYLVVLHPRAPEILLFPLVRHRVLDASHGLIIVTFVIVQVEVLGFDVEALLLGSLSHNLFRLLKLFLEALLLMLIALGDFILPN